MKTSLFTKKTRIQAPVEDVFSWHEHDGAVERLSPPWDKAELVSKTGGIRTGAEVRLKIRPIGHIPVSWTARHTGYEKNRFFRDRQVRGPFSSWVHTHHFLPDTENACIMVDSIEYALPFSTLVPAAMEKNVSSRLERIFSYRHRTLAADIACHKTYDLSPMNILVSGAGGVIGSTLVSFLRTGGHRVGRLVRVSGSRSTASNGIDVSYDPAGGWIDDGKMENIDAVIHLAGETIGNVPWTRRKKKRILESRTQTTALIARALSALKNPPKVFACASAIGYYGDRRDEILTEKSVFGDDFISHVCRQWEAAAAPAAAAGIRSVFLRIGIVLTPAGGALKTLLPVFSAGLGGRIGSGKQHVSWIGIDDVAGSFLHILADDAIEGPVNIVSPEPVRNERFIRILGRVLGRPTPFAVPESIIGAVFGQMGRETALSDTRVMPEKLLSTGYAFRHTALADALSHVLGADQTRTSPQNNPRNSALMGKIRL